jgi:hypothetical protein
VLSNLLLQCRAFVVRRETNVAIDHPVFGWYSGRLSRSLLAALNKVVTQVRTMWSSSRHLHLLIVDGLWQETASFEVSWVFGFVV